MAYLKNEYKLMYEKRTLTNKSLKATKTLPDLSDPDLTYKAADGTDVDPKNFKFIKEVNGNFYGSFSGKPEEAIVKFSVYSGNDCIYGDEVQPGPIPLFQISAIGDEEKMIAGWQTIVEEEKEKQLRTLFIDYIDKANEWTRIPVITDDNKYNYWCRDFRSEVLMVKTPYMSKKSKAALAV